MVLPLPRQGQGRPGDRASVEQRSCGVRCAVRVAWCGWHSVAHGKDLEQALGSAVFWHLASVFIQSSGVLGKRVHDFYLPKNRSEQIGIGMRWWTPGEESEALSFTSRGWSGPKCQVLPHVLSNQIFSFLRRGKLPEVKLQNSQ